MIFVFPYFQKQETNKNKTRDESEIKCEIKTIQMLKYNGRVKPWTRTAYQWRAIDSSY